MRREGDKLSLELMMVHFTYASVTRPQCINGWRHEFDGRNSDIFKVLAEKIR